MTIELSLKSHKLLMVKIFHRNTFIKIKMKICWNEKRKETLMRISKQKTKNIK